MAGRAIYRIESDDLFVEKTNSIKNEDILVDINSYEYLNSLYQSIFNIHKMEVPFENICEKDMRIVKSFTNAKSFENAVDVCLKLLASYTQENIADDEKVSDKSCVTMDSKIICDCMDTLATCRVPSHFKPGFLIILVRYGYYDKTRQLC